MSSNNDIFRIVNLTDPLLGCKVAAFYLLSFESKSSAVLVASEETTDEAVIDFLKHCGHGVTAFAKFPNLTPEKISQSRRHMITWAINEIVTSRGVYDSSNLSFLAIYLHQKSLASGGADPDEREEALSELDTLTYTPL